MRPGIEPSTGELKVLAISSAAYTARYAVSIDIIKSIYFYHRGRIVMMRGLLPAPTGKESRT